MKPNTINLSTIAFFCKPDCLEDKCIKQRKEKLLEKGFNQQGPSNQFRLMGAAV